jgi:hypothetical protein
MPLTTATPTSPARDAMLGAITEARDDNERPQ